MPWRNVLLAAVPPGVLSTTSLGADNASCELPPLMTLGQEQQLAAVRLSHYVYTLLCIISQQMTTIDRFVKSSVFCGIENSNSLYKKYH